MGANNPTQELFLIGEMRRGKEYAFDFFFNYYYPGLCVFAQKIILLSEEDAKNLVQDVFLKFWKDREKLAIRVSVRSYLFASVKNRCLDFIKKNNQPYKFLEITEDSDVADSTYDTYILSELEVLFDESLNKLSGRCREIFELSRFHGLKNREIAEKLNLSEKTIENQMTKALRILRTELKDYLPLLILFEYFYFF